MVEGFCEVQNNKARLCLQQSRASFKFKLIGSVKMNGINSTGIHIRRLDYFRLPATMRAMGDCAMVLTVLNGRETFVPAIFLE